MAATTALREALNQGISSGTFIDTKIILYSHREPSGRVSRPKVLYANSHVLKAVPYFNHLLFGNFVESQSKDFNGPIDKDETAEEYGYLSDSDLEDYDDEKATSPGRASEPEMPDPVNVITSIRNAGCDEQEERVEKGKVVKIPDVAYVTFQAFLMYLYTGAMEFAPFGSEENRRSRRAQVLNTSDDVVPLPSPKSVYRLADKYDVPGLKDLALNQIRSGLTRCNIVEESFSRFVSQYDEVRNLYVERLAFMWMEDSTTEATRTSVEKKVCSFVEGDLDHAMEILSTLWDIASKDEDIPTPNSGAPSITAHVKSPTHWTSVRRALIKSVHDGVFFDRKYWARHSKAAGALKPVYFSNMIMSDKTLQLTKLVKCFDGQHDFTSDLEEDINVESDCEESSLGVENEFRKEKEEKGQPCAVLATGSFSAWKSLFFYRCTDEISFAPLTSQGVDRRLNHIRTNTVSAMPPPCSPKSIYALANLLEIQPLCDMALEDIKSKVNSDNVVSEVFSQVTAGQKEVIEMQCNLLIYNFKNPTTVSLVRENIRHIPDGSISHCADALNLVFKNAFELKKKKRQPPGAKLRCSNFCCQWNTNPTTYSSVGTNYAFCTSCRGAYYKRCAGCGHERTGNFPSCRGCGKKFI